MNVLLHKYGESSVTMELVFFSSFWVMLDFSLLSWRSFHILFQPVIVGLVAKSSEIYWVRRFPVVFWCVHSIFLIRKQTIRTLDIKLQWTAPPSPYNSGRGGRAGCGFVLRTGRGKETPDVSVALVYSRAMASAGLQHEFHVSILVGEEFENRTGLWWYISWIFFMSNSFGCENSCIRYFCYLQLSAAGMLLTKMFASCSRDFSSLPAYCSEEPQNMLVQDRMINWDFLCLFDYLLGKKVTWVWSGRSFNYFRWNSFAFLLLASAPCDRYPSDPMIDHLCLRQLQL